MKPSPSSAFLLSLLMGIASASLTAQSPQDYDRQIEQLMNHPAVRTALDHIVETDVQTMDDLVTLTQIPAPPFMEEERAAAVPARLPALVPALLRGAVAGAAATSARSADAAVCSSTRSARSQSGRECGNGLNVQLRTCNN